MKKTLILLFVFAVCNASLNAQTNKSLGFYFFAGNAQLKLSGDGELNLLPILYVEDNTALFGIDLKGSFKFITNNIICSSDGSVLAITASSNSYSSDKMFSFDFEGKVSKIGNVNVSYDYEGKLSKVGSINISYNYENRVSKIGGDNISYTYDGRVSKVGSTNISYDYENKVSKIGSSNISYTYDGNVSKVGSTNISYTYDNKASKIGDSNISYTYDNKISKVGDMNISYTYDGKVDKIGNTTISYWQRKTAYNKSIAASGAWPCNLRQ